MNYIWTGPGVLKNGRDTIYEPGDRVDDRKHDSRLLKKWLEEGRVEYR